MVNLAALKLLVGSPRLLCEQAHKLTMAQTADLHMPGRADCENQVGVDSPQILPKSQLAPSRRVS